MKNITFLKKFGALVLLCFILFSNKAYSQCDMFTANGATICDGNPVSLSPTLSVQGSSTINPSNTPCKAVTAAVSPRTTQNMITTTIN